MTPTQHLYLSDHELKRKKLLWRLIGYGLHLAFLAAALMSLVFGLMEKQAAFWSSLAFVLIISILMLIAIQRMLHWGDLLDDRRLARTAQDRHRERKANKHD